ncbi:hypothetical protein [Streptomyces sp. SID13726]|uniref:hypothetical protein n=1 Tax=Streptomyces sp. SID13726 TaxID=2706058 RepID=UPI0013BA7324|nr:hypothetical protein [Streptomyces sp. SID13726]NEB00992.1 hypothetical protein [Streptomyces sp. SID13726]
MAVGADQNEAQGNAETTSNARVIQAKLRSVSGRALAKRLYAGLRVNGGIPAPV